jgi:hypothetical protein
MALTLESVGRNNEASGQAFAVFNDGSQRHQSMVPADADGNPVAYGSNAVTGGTAADSLVVKAAAGALGELHGYLEGLSGSAVCIMLFNATSLPANGTAPVWRVPLIGGVGNYFFPTGFQFATGLVAAFSSTHDDLTVTTGSEGYLHARYR